MHSEESHKEVFKPQFEIDHYEILYQGLCSQYSDAYLKGSDWYVGDSLKEWWYIKANKAMDLNKLMYIYSRVESWIN